ncbi:MAG: hypothetical protein AVDCRST_MAG31-574, partial [uncultured Sphingomonas sp.]
DPRTAYRLGCSGPARCGPGPVYRRERAAAAGRAGARLCREPPRGAGPLRPAAGDRPTQLPGAGRGGEGGARHRRRGGGGRLLRPRRGSAPAQLGAADRAGRRPVADDGAGIRPARLCGGRAAGRVGPGIGPGARPGVRPARPAGARPGRLSAGARRGRPRRGPPPAGAQPGDQRQAAGGAQHPGSAARPPRPRRHPCPRLCAGAHRRRGRRAQRGQRRAARAGRNHGPVPATAGDPAAERQGGGRAPWRDAWRCRPAGAELSGPQLRGTERPGTNLLGPKLFDLRRASARPGAACTRPAGRNRSPASPRQPGDSAAASQRTGDPAAVLGSHCIGDPAGCGGRSGPAPLLGAAGQRARPRPLARSVPPAGIAPQGRVRGSERLRRRGARARPPAGGAVQERRGRRDLCGRSGVRRHQRLPVDQRSRSSGSQASGAM